MSDHIAVEEQSPGAAPGPDAGAELIVTVEPIVVIEPIVATDQRPLEEPALSLQGPVLAPLTDGAATGRAIEGPLAVPEPDVAALCVPVSEADPCGPDLDADGDGDYLNFFASAEGVLPTSFFSIQEPDKSFFSAQDEQFANARAALPSEIAAIKPLLERTRDLRLLTVRARLLILNRDLTGFATTVAAAAEWLDRFWDNVHPRLQDGDSAARLATLATLDLSTVVFPLQYTSLFDAPRIGAVSYRAWLIASEQAKSRSGEQKHAASVLADAVADTDPAALASSRRDVALLKASLGRIRSAFHSQGISLGLETLPALVDKISAFINPPGAAGATGEQASVASAGDAAGGEGQLSGTAPASLTQARKALEAIADYYSRLEPSSPTLPLVRQAHELIGKSFVEIMSILVPTQVDKAAFRIGTDQIFELPVGKLPKNAEAGSGAEPPGRASDPMTYSVQSRAQAIALLTDVQRFFRAAEPSSPVPMLCERARALAERDFMGVLRDVLPKAALKTPAADK